MIIGTEAEYQSNAGSTQDTPYLALTGELWGVLCEYLWQNWPRYNGTALYVYKVPWQDFRQPSSRLGGWAVSTDKK